jgi:bifunctional enzyme CysN/CysC
MPVQDVYKFDERRLVVGRIETGRLRVGDLLLFSPEGKKARVASIETWSVPEPQQAGVSGQSVALTLSEQIFIERGSLASHERAPPVLTDVFRARLFWLADEPLRVGERQRLKLLTSDIEAEVERIERIIDTDDLSTRAASTVERNNIAEVVLRTERLVALDQFVDSPRTGRFVIVRDYRLVGGGVISMEGYPDQRRAESMRSRRPPDAVPIAHRVTLAERWQANRHKSGILWFTGLSGSGKSTLAFALERVLFAKGYRVAVLDGDNLRQGLNSDLGFSPEDRVENLRRAGEIATLFAQCGMLVITAFISPYRSERARARERSPELFHEIFVNAPIDVCEARDVKGLYRLARRGELKDFTGISAPYEPPASPELALLTAEETVERSVARLVDYVDRHFAV